MEYHVPPQYQGQTVERAYSIDHPDYVVQCVTDRSDGTVTYYVAEWTEELERWADAIGPQNAPPPAANWIAIVLCELED